VSRLHCEIRRTGVVTVRLRDVGSKNGAWVGGARVYDVELPAGGRIRIGDTLIEIGLSRDKQRRTVWTGPDRFGDLYGASPAMHRIFAMLARIVGTDEPVGSQTGASFGIARRTDAASRAGEGDQDCPFTPLEKPLAAATAALIVEEPAQSAAT
ncbi:MAG TPA: FHA domain-containing protein, partial [Thermoanaerobaculia bacterium]|nr:FHA domain-containing protein [Thermoanaerobaculia bacterium]